ncbi:hypothetical protein [Reichenbachiella versicolor]|uniref:hypothetical protein n=1 Tax=Reichenbachiella versicolor TaxID=1821036 RepID=UPI000D6E693D|nr:hypothetical protein [Reichenbachiella versicolor]
MFKHYTLILTFLLSSFAFSAFCEDVEELIRKDVKSKYSNVTIKKIEKKPWGVYWVYTKIDCQFGDGITLRVTYDLDIKITGNMYTITNKVPEKILNKIKIDSPIGWCTYTDNGSGRGNYRIQHKNGQYSLFNEKLKPVEVGEMEDDVVLTHHIKKDIYSRLNDAQIISGRKSKGNLELYQFSIVAKTANGHYNPGMIIYTPDGEWSRTNYYLKDYFRLPLELLMYVNDNGGLDTFGAINKVEQKDKPTVYEVTYQDGKKVRLDEDLNVM